MSLRDDVREVAVSASLEAAARALMAVFEHVQRRRIACFEALASAEIVGQQTDKLAGAWDEIKSLETHVRGLLSEVGR